MDETTYQIRDWSSTFETSKSRNYRSLTWVALPVSPESAGYQELVDRDDAAEIYGAWCAVLAVAARCPVRGVFASSDGKPLTVTRIARMSHLPQCSVAKMWSWALGIGWIIPWFPGEASAGTCEGPGRSPAGPLPDQTRPDLTEPNTTRPDLTPSSVESVVDFDWSEDALRDAFQMARELNRACRSKLPGEEIWQLSCLFVVFEPAAGFELAEKLRSGQVRRLKQYVASLKRKFVEEKGVCLPEFVKKVPTISQAKLVMG